MSNTTQYIKAYYVDPRNGNDNNSGTFNRPFRTIQQGIDLAGANKNDGNKIFLKEGTYNLKKPLFFNAYSGDSNAHLTIQPIPGEKAIIDGRGVTSSSSLIEIKNVSNINIFGLEIRNSPTHGIEVINGKNINIYNNRVYRTQGMGIRVRGYMAEIPSERDTRKQSSNVLIKSNEVYQTNLSNSGANKSKNNWGSAIQAWNANNVAIVDNTVSRNYGEGIALSVVDAGLIKNNTLYDNFSVQVYLDNATDSVVNRNFIYNTGNRNFYRDNYAPNGIALANEIYNVANPARFYLNNNSIRRNVIVGANTGIMYGTWAGIHQNAASNNWQGIKNTKIIHNTIYDSEFHTIRFDGDFNIKNVKVARNIFDQKSKADLSLIDNLTGLNFQRNLWFGGKPGDGSSRNDIIADPQFVNPGGNQASDYRLQADSLAIDAINSSSSNNPWITDGQPDLGAIEFGEPVLIGADAI